MRYYFQIRVNKVFGQVTCIIIIYNMQSLLVLVQTIINGEYAV